MRDRKMQCQRLGNLECSHITSTRFPRGEQSSKKRTQQSTNIQICKFNTSALKVMLPDFRAVYTALYYSVRVERLTEQQSYNTTVLYKIKQLIVSDYSLSKLIKEMSALLQMKREEIIDTNLCLFIKMVFFNSTELSCLKKVLLLANCLYLFNAHGKITKKIFNRIIASINYFF